MRGGWARKWGSERVQLVILQRILLPLPYDIWQVKALFPLAPSRWNWILGVRFNKHECVQRKAQWDFACRECKRAELKERYVWNHRELIKCRELSRWECVCAIARYGPSWVSKLDGKVLACFFLLSQTIDHPIAFWLFFPFLLTLYSLNRTRIKYKGEL